MDAEPARGACTHLAHVSALLASSPSWEKPSAWGREQWAVSHTKRMRPGFARAPGTEHAVSSRQFPVPASPRHLEAEPCLGGSTCGSIRRGSAQGSLCPGWVCDRPTTETLEAMWCWSLVWQPGPERGVCVCMYVSEQVNVRVKVCLIVHISV